MIKLENVSKMFGTGVYGLQNINLSIEPGEFVFLVGHTGSGKTTMLRLLIREMIPTEGTITIGEFDLAKLPSRKIPHLRKKIGIVFQDLKLLTDRTIYENILLPLQVAGVNIDKAKERVEELLGQVKIIDHRDKFPIQLSGGELQRVAIARALALSPDVLLADEPTGNLDTDTAWGIVELLSAINKHGTTIIMATHNLEIVNKLSKRVVTLDSGKMVKDEKGKTEMSTKQEAGEIKKNEKHHLKHDKEEKKEKSEKHDRPKIFVKMEEKGEKHHGIS